MCFAINLKKLRVHFDKTMKEILLLSNGMYVARFKGSFHSAKSHLCVTKDSISVMHKQTGLKRGGPLPLPSIMRVLSSLTLSLPFMPAHFNPFLTTDFLKLSHPRPLSALHFSSTFSHTSIFLFNQLYY